MRTIHYHCCRLGLALVLCSTIIIVSGCHAIRPKPFETFSSAMQQSATASDTLLTFNTYWAQEDFIYDFATAKNSRLSDLKLKISQDFNWTVKLKPLPLFLTLQQARKTTDKLNEALISYSTLLLNLTDKSLINEKSFNKLAKNLNKNATEAINATTLQVPAQGVELLSKASAEAMSAYLQHRQRGILEDAIKQNQPNIEKYSASATILLNITGSQIKVYYSAQAGQLVRQWHSANHKSKIKLTKKILDLNQRYIVALALLRELNNFYATLPEANLAIAKSLNTNPIPLPALIKLNNSAEHLLELQKTLKKYIPAKSK